MCSVKFGWISSVKRSKNTLLIYLSDAWQRMEGGEGIFVPKNTFTCNNLKKKRKQLKSLKLKRLKSAMNNAVGRSNARSSVTYKGMNIAVVKNGRNFEVFLSFYYILNIPWFITSRYEKQNPATRTYTYKKLKYQMHSGTRWINYHRALLPFIHYWRRREISEKIRFS